MKEVNGFSFYIKYGKTRSFKSELNLKNKTFRLVFWNITVSLTNADIEQVIAKLSK